MRHVLVLLTLSLAPFAAGQASAQAPDAVACAAIEANDDRLACYDSLFRPATPTGDALVFESRRPILAVPNGSRPAEMRISCAAGEPIVVFEFAGQPMSDTAAVSFQVDAGLTTVRTLAASTDNTHLNFARSSDATAFIDSLLQGGTNLKVRVTPPRQRSIMVDFRILERAPEIAAFRSSCIEG
jgi:type VI secretion system protein VasI